MTRGRLAGVLVAVVVAAVLGVLLAGRGAGSPVAAAATKSANAGGADVSFSLVLHGRRLAHVVQVTGSGVVDGPNADITISDTGAPAAFPTSLHALLVQQGGDELAFVHATPMPAFTGGKNWIEVDLSQLAGSHGIDLGKLAAGASGETPTQVLDLLRRAGATVTDLGPATAGGASTTHYRVLVDAAELAQVAGLPFAPAGKLATKQVPVDVWIGTDGLVHRLALTVRRVSFSATLSGYGANVSVTPPSSSEVLNVTGFFTGAGGLRPFG